jgi:uncharacterized protein YceK
MFTLGFVVLALLLSGCATIFTGTSSRISVSSTPPDAYFTVKADNGMEVGSGKTPSSIRVSKGKDYYVEITLDGYKPKSVMVGKQFNAVSVLNFTNLLAWGIDLLSGAIWEPSPKFVNVTLEHAFLEGGETQLLCIVKSIENSKLTCIQTVELEAIHN